MAPTGSPLTPAVSHLKSRQPVTDTKTVKFVYFVTIASFFIAVASMWDVSWHISIGRDKFLSPPHILLYVAGIFGGLFSAIQILFNSFKAPVESRSSFVKVWGIFYSSLGPLFCIWGATALLTSAPFDNWWHGAYGLDVQILSPPHALLVLGVFAMQLGACATVATYINLAGPADKMFSRLQFLFTVSASSFLCLMFGLLSNTFVGTRLMRTSISYQASTVITLMLLPAFSRALRMKWGMTAISLGYFLMTATANWVLQLFPAEPRLGPILTHTTHFQPADFPVLIVVPAIFMDLMMQRSRLNDWGKAVLLSIIFVPVLVAIQYPFSGFLIESSGSHNWFFGGNSWFYKSPPDAPFRHKFNPKDVQPLAAFVKGIGIALVGGIFVSRIGLRWGDWMLRIQR